MIIVDSREQNPIWEEKEKVRVTKLDEGDYTTEKLLNKAHIERKSGQDLYGSIIQGHERFRAEIERANSKGIKLSVFVECTRKDFIGKKFEGGWRLQCKPAVLAKIIDTIQEKYGIDFIWCDGRDDFKEKALQWFNDQSSILGAIEDAEVTKN
jgi:ERCC4-type nuclease